MGDEDAAPLCDLVLEGGVTSALIYTGLIARLSCHYRFKRLGGTSSGAVAAAAGAIAQRAKLETLKKPPGQREKPPDAAFEEGVREFPRNLAKTDKQGRTALFRLFQAQESTCRGHRVVATWLKYRAQGWGTATVRALATTVCNFWVSFLIGALPGLWILLTTWRPLWPNGLQDPVNWISPALGLALMLGLGLLAAVLWAVWTTLRGMMRNHFGLCSGMQGAEYGDDGTALTPTLHRFFNELLGRNAEAEKPVIFAELWGKDALAGGDREIDLQVITTALNLRRPFRLPNEPGVDPLGGFFYDPKEWKELFPKVVLRWLEKHRRLADGPRVTNEQGDELYALPPPPQWPVLVAVRLSLSFPGLLSAVPMYTIEWRRKLQTEKQPPARTPLAGATGEKALVPVKVYFSDGGITSNCPVHLFDAPLPGHPTFAVRLDTFESGDGGRHRIWLPGDRKEPPPRVRPFAARCTLAVAWSFVFGIVDTAREWRDGLQRSLPGYRERVVVVGLKPREGGLNLAMSPRTIRRVAALGSRAALRLQRAFDGPRTDGQPNAWDRHRWIRLRSTLAAAQRYLEELQKPHYRDLLERLRATLAAAQSYLEELQKPQPPREPRYRDLLERLRATLAAAQSCLEELQKPRLSREPRYRDLLERLRATLTAAQTYFEELQKPQPSNEPSYRDLLERLRSTLAAAQTYLEELQKPQPSNEPSYRELLEQVPPIEPHHLPDRAAVAQAQALLDGLSALEQGDRAWPDRDLGDNAPKPAPRLRMSSPW